LLEKVSGGGEEISGFVKVPDHPPPMRAIIELSRKRRLEVGY
jgi:hypothetical protein